jgi:hypothetical protein
MSQIHAHRFCLGDSRTYVGPSSVHVQNPYKNASRIPYIIESKDWLPFVGDHRTFLKKPDVDLIRISTVATRLNVLEYQ